MKLTMTILLLMCLPTVPATEQLCSLPDGALDQQDSLPVSVAEQQDFQAGQAKGQQDHGPESQCQLSLQGRGQQDSLHKQAKGQQDSLRVMFWNLENFYDTKNDGQNESDAEFSSGGARHWTSRLYSAKCNGVSKIILKAADVYGSLPDAIGFAEVENRKVVEDVVLDTPLRKLGYRIVHFDSPDHRGIDCALLYRKSKLELTDSKALHLYDSDGNVIATRDILLARFGELAIFVNHHPSKVGDKTDGRGDFGKAESSVDAGKVRNQNGFDESRRGVAMKRMLQAVDSLEAAGVRKILCIGDFNDDLWSKRSTPNTLTTASGRPPLGTIKYEGAWEKIDGCFTRGFDRVEESIFDDPALLTKDSAYGGLKPLRTWSGPRCLGGISDHLPIVVTLFD